MYFDAVFVHENIITGVRPTGDLVATTLFANVRSATCTLEAIAFMWIKMVSTEKSEWWCLKKSKERSTQKESMKCCIDCLDDISPLSGNKLGEAHGNFSDQVRQTRLSFDLASSTKSKRLLQASQCNVYS